MMKCEVTIVGKPPGLLMNNPANMDPNKKQATRASYEPEEMAAKACYWTEDRSSLAFPAMNLYRALIASASYGKLPGKIALAPVIAGDVSVEPFMIPFNTKKYEIFSCRAVLGKVGIIRSRPLLKEWSLTFRVCWETSMLGKDFHLTVLPQLLEKLGTLIGIGDFRPAKKGPFGRFTLKEIKLL